MYELFRLSQSVFGECEPVCIRYVTCSDSAYSVVQHAAHDCCVHGGELAARALARRAVHALDATGQVNIVFCTCRMCSAFEPRTWYHVRQVVLQ